MATHSNILAWRIPQKEETGGLQSKGSQTKNWTQVIMHAHTHTQSRIKIWKNRSHKKGILVPKK